jgi:hypothetical protein
LVNRISADHPPFPRRCQDRRNLIDRGGLFGIDDDIK